jgi:hypothetical protein
MPECRSTYPAVSATVLYIEPRENASAAKAPNVMLYLELPEGLHGSKIPFKRFKANIL